jgi:hypothetical protein
VERYTDDAYHIMGTPRNPEMPETFDSDGNPIDPDLGLAGHAGPKHVNYVYHPAQGASNQDIICRYKKLTSHPSGFERYAVKMPYL